ncbi:MAG: helix-turn-helix domain-containing protein [Leptospirales bacterium]
MKKNERDQIKFEESSGNIFADLGFPDAEDRLQKAELAYEIYKAISFRGLTQREAAKVMEIDQPKVSTIIRGNLKGFSLERLMGLLRKMGVEYRLSKKTGPFFAAYTGIFTGQSDIDNPAYPLVFKGMSVSAFPASSEYISDISMINWAEAVTFSYADVEPSRTNATTWKKREADESTPVAA